MIGSSSGEKAAGKTYDVEDARITVEGGSVDIIYANRSISSGNGAFSKASEQHIGTGTVTVKIMLLLEMFSGALAIHP